MRPVVLLALFLPACAADAGRVEEGLVVAVAQRLPAPGAELGSLDLPGENVRVIVQSNVAYVVGSAGLHLIDVSDATAPTLLTTVPLGYYGWDLALENGHAFIANGDGGLAVVDISPPASAALVATHPTGHQALGLDVQLGRAVIALGTSGTDVIDVTDPLAPVTVGHEDNPYPEDALIVGDRVYLAHSFLGVSAYRMVETAGAVDLVLEGRNTQVSFAYHLVYQPATHLVYASDFWGAVVAVDAEPDLAVPPAQGNMATIGVLPLNGLVNGIDLDGDTLHVGNVYEGWTVVDAQDPAAMSVHSVRDTPGAANGVDATKLPLPGVGRVDCVVVADSGALRVFLSPQL